MTNKPPISKERPLAYCAGTGLFFRKMKTHWKQTGLTKDNDGYLRIKYKGRPMTCHKLALQLNGTAVPDGMTIDHINRVRTDNRLSNLRVMSHLDNCLNSGTGMRAVLLPSGRFAAKYGDTHLGVFDDKTIATGTAMWHKFKLLRERYDKVTGDY